MSSKAFLNNLLISIVPLSGGMQDEICQVNLIGIGMTKPPDEVFLCGKNSAKMVKNCSIDLSNYPKIVVFAEILQATGFQIFCKSSVL